MPLYEYKCDDHGHFEEFQSMSHGGKPVACPICGQMSARVYSAPNVALMDPAQKSAMDRSIQSRYEPKTISRPKKELVQKDERPAKKVQKAYRGARSWVMESASSAL